MRYIIAISTLAGALLLPQIAYNAILWQDDFDSYYEGMPLEESPSWDEFFGFPGGFITVEDGEGFCLSGFGSFYIATGGASNPNMKVFVDEVSCGGDPFSHCSSVGVVTRLSEDGSEAYLALYEEQMQEDQYLYQYISLSAMIDFDEVYIIHDSVTECPESISIIALGENPVHITACFDGHQLTWYDNDFNLTSGFGGLYGSCTMSGGCGLDNFKEETVLDYIQPTSLGTIKALYK